MGENARVDERWLAAARGGHHDTVFDLLRQMPDAAVRGDEGSALLRAAAFGRQAVPSVVAPGEQSGLILTAHRRQS